MIEYNQINLRILMILINLKLVGGEGVFDSDTQKFILKNDEIHKEENDEIHKEENDEIHKEENDEIHKEEIPFNFSEDDLKKPITMDQLREAVIAQMKLTGPDLETALENFKDLVSDNESSTGGYKNKKSRKAKKAKKSRKGKKGKKAKRTRKGKKGKKAKRTRKRK